MGNGTAVVLLLRKVIKINWAGQAAVARDRALRVRRPDGDEGGDDGGEDEGVALLAGDDDEPSERHDGADDAWRLAADSEADRARTECERPSFCLQMEPSAGVLTCRAACRIDEAKIAEKERLVAQLEKELAQAKLREGGTPRS